MKRKIVGIAKDAVTKEVQKYLDQVAGLSAEKVAKTVARAYSKDVKLNRFLAQAAKGFEAGLGIFVDAQRREKIIEAVQEFGTTNNEQKQAMVIHIAQSDIELEVERKRNEITDKGKLVLNAEQKDALAAALVKYKEFLNTRMMPGVLDLAASLGIVEYEGEKVKAAAVAE